MPALDCAPWRRSDITTPSTASRTSLRVLGGGGGGGGGPVTQPMPATRSRLRGNCQPRLDLISSAPAICTMGLSWQRTTLLGRRTGQIPHSPVHGGSREKHDRQGVGGHVYPARRSWAWSSWSHPGIFSITLTTDCETSWVLLVVCLAHFISFLAMHDNSTQSIDLKCLPWSL